MTQSFWGETLKSGHRTVFDSPTVVDYIVLRMATYLLFICQFSTVHALTAVYLPTSCNGHSSVTTSMQLESGTGLTYLNNMNCMFTVNVVSPFVVLAKIKRFELEPKQSGQCHDYVNFYDGANSNGSVLNSEVMCGQSLMDTMLTSGGQQMSIHFVTDSKAVYLGFNIIFTAVTKAPCGAEQFECNNSFCVSASLACDNYDQCGDGSDEENCAASPTDSNSDHTSLVVGLVLGLAAALLIGVLVLIRFFRHRRWRRFQNDFIDQEDVFVYDAGSAYPVTNKYFRGIRGHPGNQCPDQLNYGNAKS